MATELSRRDAPVAAEVVDEGRGLWYSIHTFRHPLLRPLASLRLTVVLFALSIFLVFAGTLAQRFQDIWDVLDQYFRTPIARIEWRIFFPRPAAIVGAGEAIQLEKPPAWFPFPGGWMIGGVMALNLVAAHRLRYRAAARGGRLLLGSAIIAAGNAVTVAVVASGNNSDEIAGTPWMPWDVLWLLLKLTVAAAFAGGAVTVGALLLRGSWSTRRIEIVVTTAASLLLGILLGWLLVNPESTLDYSAMRILWQLIKGLAAAGVLLVGCWLVFAKRAGIVLLHSGIGLLMFSELLVGTQAVESMMSIREGETVNFSQDVRTAELAVVDPSDAETDDVVVVPQRLLEQDRAIEHDELPFDVQVVHYFRNSNLVKIAPDVGDEANSEGNGEADDQASDEAEADDEFKNPATQGIGLEWRAVEKRPGTGTDAGGEVDVPAAYVTFIDKQSGRPLGTHLLGALLASQDIPEKVDVGDKTYDVFLRFKRHYKTYSLMLKDVRFDKYIGTSTAKNYSSDLRLVDPTHHVDREVKIWMNNPLRFGGETFYQSQFSADPTTGEETTGLQVVSNTGWMIPYVCCMIVGVGLVWQFGLTLLRFLNRRRQDSVPASLGPAQSALHHARQRQQAAEHPVRHWAGFLLAGAVVLLAATLIARVAVPPRAVLGEMNLYEFGKIPLVYEGRVKPFDTLARNSLLVISGKQSFKDAAGQRQPAIRWLLDVIARPDLAVEHKAFKIENLDLLSTLGLERRSGFTYSIEEFRAQFEEFDEQAELANEVEHESDLSLYQKKVLELERKLRLYVLLSNSFRRPSIDQEDARQAQQDLIAAIQAQQKLAEMQPPLAVPPRNDEEEWQPYATAWTRAYAEVRVLGQEPNPATLALDAIFIAYANDDVSNFNLKVAEYRGTSDEKPKRQPANRIDLPEDVDTFKVAFESFFNHFEPFFYCWVLYIAGGLLAALGWLGFSGPLNRASFWLIAFTFLVHTFALLARIYISGRPPVTNLYSSAVFIGWGAVLAGIVLEAVYKLGVGNIVATVAGFCTLLIAHYLAGDGDTFIVLQAVLDTQFWLATHVVCITLGYAATFVAGLLGVIYIFNRLAPGLRKVWWYFAFANFPMFGMAQGVEPDADAATIGKALTRMIYGFVCFALLFSFVGTVLGGLWADDSWGRFWGWDPKENGALMIVIWNALVLHARWGAMIKERGLAVLAVFGNVVTAWSWFGVNELGAGLHSYGFTEGVALALCVAVLVHLGIIAAGMLPKNLWSSVRGNAVPAEMDA